MKFRCCQNAMSSLMITYKTLAYCPMEEKVAFIENYNGEIDFTEKYIKARNKHIQNCKNGNLPAKCLKCSQNIEADWDETFGIKYLGVANRTKCSCNCIYCTVSQGDTKKRKDLNKKKIWNIKPVLQTLENNHLLAPEGEMFIAGGECSEYPKEELSWLINFAFRNNFSIEFASSGMFYSKEIEKALKTGNTKIRISVDSGSKELYEYIKRVKFYDKVWNNLKKYIEAAEKGANSMVSIKYIVLDGINDNIEELQKFLKKCDEVKCKDIRIAMEYFWLTEDGGSNQKMPKGSKNILSYIESLNDPRIEFDMFTKIFEKKTSAKQYNKELEKNLLDGHTKLKIIVFSGTPETYLKIAKQDLFNNIWTNIKTYSKHAGISISSRSSIFMEYKIIPGENDTIEEIQAFLNKCDEYNLKNIEFSLFNNDTSNINTEELQKLVDFINKQPNKFITISQQLLSLLNN